jgi:TP901 family phage tail tape measure protein
MADEIRQELTFDASSAITSLDSLTSSLDKTRTALVNFGRAVGSINQNAGSATNALNSLAAAAAKLQGSVGAGLIPANTGQNINSATSLVDQFGNSLDKTGKSATSVTAGAAAAGNAVKKTGSDAKNAAGGVNELKISFETLARVIQTQLIVRAIGIFTRGLSQAARDASDFQKQISEIQTITDNSFGSFDRAADAVRGISDAFNQPLGEVSEGLYQTISNQIQGASAQIQVLETASNLAKVGVADLSSTVGLLTGTINAFELDASNANRIAAVFFETVRLGRTRISELANSFGTVAPLAAEAGIGFEELAAAFATVTINGVDTAKAATQLRGIINAFLKPTKELQAVLSEAGFSSGEFALETLGLGGALALLQQETGGSASELAKLIPRVRGLAGAMVLARNDGENLVRTTEDIQAASTDLLREKLEIRLETNAEQVERDLNRIRNALTVDLGQALLATAKQFSDVVGGADTLVPIIKALTPLVIGVGVAAAGAAVALGIYTLAVKTANSANALLAFSSAQAARGLAFVGVSSKLSASLLAFASSAIPIGIGFAIGAALGKGINDALVDRAREAAKEASDTIKESVIAGAEGDAFRAIEEQGRERIKAIKDVVKEQQSALNETRRIEQQRTEVFLRSNSRIFDDSIKVFDAILSANKQLIRDLETEQQNAARAQESSLDRQADLRSTIEDRAFKNSIKNLNDRQRLFRLERQGAQLAAQANRELAKAQTEAEAETALDKLQRAEGFLAEADALAKSSGELTLQNRLFQTRQSISRASLRSEQEFEKTQARIRKEAEEALKAEEKRVETLNREVKEARDAVAEFKKAKTAEEQLTAARVARAEIADITPELAFGTGPVDFSELVSFDEFRENLLQTVENTGVDLSVSPEIKLDQLADEFFIETRKSVVAGVRAAEEALAAAGIELDIKINVDESGIAQLQGAIDEVIQTGQGETTRVEDTTARAADALRRSAEAQAALAAAAREARNGASAFVNLLADVAILDAAELTPFEQALTRVKDETVKVAENFKDLTPGETFSRLNKLRDVFTQLEDKAGFLDKAETTVLRTEIDALINKLLEANDASFESAIRGAGTVKATLDTIPQAGAQFNQQLNQALNTANQISSTLSRAGSSATAATASVGRFFPRFFADGGFASRGTDTIPAMLSPGEFVVNARSTKRFFSQLQAINAGRQPVYRQEGGPVTTVGDINVTVSSGKGAETTGRQIARSIRRELRRGTSQL